MVAIPRRGRYVGRLTFDPDSETHTDPKGRRVVTDDGGLTWRYAKRGDSSHNARYHKGVVHTLVPTTDEGHAAGDPAHAHHQVVAPGPSHPDSVAPTQTGHTEAWKEQA